MCGTTHKTVQRVIAAHEAGEGRPVRAVRARNYDQVSELVADRVKATQGRISAKRLLPAARTAGFVGSARNFRRLVADAKAAFRREHGRGRRPGVWSLGSPVVHNRDGPPWSPVKPCGTAVGRDRPGAGAARPDVAELPPTWSYARQRDAQPWRQLWQSDAPHRPWHTAGGGRCRWGRGWG